MNDMHYVPFLLKKKKKNLKQHFYKIYCSAGEAEMSVGILTHLGLGNKSSSLS